MYRGPVIGHCHICKGLEPIEYCDLCKHWMCIDCKAKLFPRGLAAVKALIAQFTGETLDCCGPVAKVA